MRSSFGPSMVRGAALALLLGAAGCYGGEGSDESAGEVEAAPPAETPVQAAVAAPDTTGAAMWAHLQESGYQESWELWPDKGRLYPGQQPHGAQLTTYMNDIAFSALQSGAAEMPAGAIIVKENYMPDGMLAAVTTMFKTPGYNAEHNDWFFTKHLASGELDQAPNGMALEGRLPGCQGCHIGKADNDYLFTGELGGG